MQTFHRILFVLILTPKSLRLDDDNSVVANSTICIV